MRSAANSNQNLVPLVVYLDLEEKVVSLNPSHHVTDDDNRSPDHMMANHVLV